MADDITQIKNPSLLPESLQFGIEDNKIVSISGYQLAGGGGSTTQSDFVFYPDVVDGNLSFTLGTTGQHPGPMGPYYISGGKGDDGFSPTITLTPLSPDPLQTHTQGGTKVDITYLNNGVTATATYTAWNGENGQDAAVNLAEGVGIQITQNSNTYTISVSADYSGAAVTSAKTWVGQQGYLTSVPDTYALKSDIPITVAQLTDSADYAKKTDLEGFVTSSDITTQDTDYVMTTTGWKVLSLPGGGMTQVIHDTTLTGQGNANDNKLGVAWSALSGNTIASALSANSATTAANLGTSSFADITGAINTKADATAISDMLTKSVAAETYQTIAGMSNYLTTTVASQTYQTIAGMSNYLTTTVASQTYLDKTTYATDSATFVTSSDLVITGDAQYALTTTGWAKIATPTTFTGVTTTGSISGGGVNNDTIGLLTSAENALTAVDGKVSKPSTSLVDKYLVLRTDNAGNVSGWCDLQDQSYSKSEANGTFVATANIDSTTLSGDGKSVSTKLGVKTDVIATKDYVNSSFLPTSGGTVSGQLVVSGGSTFDEQFLKITRENVNGYARLGLGQYGALALKTDDSNSHTTQVNISPNASNDQLVQVQHNGGTIGYLIPAVTATTTAGLTDDGILHIIVEN